MKDVPRTEWARRLIEDQIARLGELRNASPRDPGFKLWRQTSLTVIQRIWPGDLARSERFRRVPFSPTSTKASRSQIRENYERGCAEAGSYLKSLMAEIGTQGIQTAPGALPSAPMRLPAEMLGDLSAAPAEPADPRDLFEPSPLERFEPPAAGPKSGDQAVAEIASDPDIEFDLPRFQPPARPEASPAPPSPAAPKPPAAGPTPARPASPAPARPTSAIPARPSGAVPARPASAIPARPASPSPSAPKPVAPSAKQPAAKPPLKPQAPAAKPASGAEPEDTHPPRRSDRRALKEMLGFADDPRSGPAPSVPAARTPAPPPARSFEEPQDEDDFASPLPPPVFAAEDEIEDDSSEVDDAFEEEAFGADEPAEETAAEDEVEAVEVEAVEEEEEFEELEIGEVEDIDAEAVASSIAPPSASHPDIDFLSRPVKPAAPSPAGGPARSLADLISPAARQPAREPAGAAAAPVPQVQQPAPEPAQPGPGHEAPAAAAFAALAGEVARLGVPEGQRAAARAALLDMARRIDDGSASWDSVCQILTMAAAYPAVARRAIPLLVPFLEVD